ncbi:anthranilate synthase component I family protein, partial [Patescibacteria group bacterium]|nr:anthranilate synthase component I family protein [Patescibacteria group bacterium]
TGLKDSAKKVCKNSAKAVSVRSNVTYEMYEKNIKKIKDYLVNGETYQVNYSQRFMADFSGDSWLAYKKFTRINPSPFQCYFNFENVKVVSNSPERLVCAKTVQNSSLKIKKLRLESRPIKGTVPRGKTEEEERILGKELIDSKKDAAELIMIVDLVRNDLGRVCEIGSVEVNELRTIEKYSHVQHTMSNVVGILQDDKDWTDVIKTMFPGGSITGCPKYRTMQIIDELEEFKRGLYCGSAGYIGFDGQFDFNIMIRTLSVVDGGKESGRVYFNSGGGIVFDSTPESEYEETKDKAEALMRAIG